MSSAPRSFPQRLAELAAADPDRVVAIFADGEHEQSLTRAELLARSRRIARLLAARGVVAGDIVAVGLPNTPEHLAAMLAIWTLGACALPLNPRQPARERDAILETAEARLAVADWTDAVTPVLGAAALAEADGLSADPLEERIPSPGIAIASGGSTGRPKIIVQSGAWARRVGESFGPFSPEDLGFSGPATVQLIPGALFHNTPFGFAWYGVFEGHELVVMAQFDADRALALIDRHRVTFAGMVPTMLQRMAASERFAEHDLGSLRALFHTGGACPAWLKRRWIERLGPERLIEGYGQTEGVGATLIRGDEWLAHPGSVGRLPTGFDVRIVREDGSVADGDEVGEIYIRHADTGKTSSYLGAPPVRELDGFATVGDLGWLDADGYLYISDRRVDMIVSGATNVFPAEVEAALSERADIADVAVIGLPDATWGRRVHAIVQPRDAAAAPDPAELERHCRERLSGYKVPKSFELVERLPRDEAGKLRRAALVAERTTEER